MANKLDSFGDKLLFLNNLEINAYQEAGDAVEILERWRTSEALVEKRTKYPSLGALKRRLNLEKALGLVLSMGLAGAGLYYQADYPIEAANALASGYLLRVSMLAGRKLNTLETSGITDNRALY